MQLIYIMWFYVNGIMDRVVGVILQETMHELFIINQMLKRLLIKNYLFAHLFEV